MNNQTEIVINKAIATPRENQSKAWAKQRRTESGNQNDVSNECFERKVRCNLDEIVRCRPKKDTSRYGIVTVSR